MINTIKKTTYKAFGFSISSDFDLPELPYIDMEHGQANITVIRADLTTVWSELAEPNRHFIVKNNFVLFQVPNVAIYLIKNGNEIIVSPMNGAENDQIRLFILGTCMGTLLLQRKVLPLHGSAVVINDKAYAIVGDSGAGKSTLASAFLSHGYQLLSDDVIPVTLSKENIPTLTPAYPQQKLWLESLHQFGIESKNLRPIIDRETKFAVPVSGQFATRPAPLAGVFELTKTDNHDIEIYPIQKLEQLHTLFNHTYRNFLVTRLGLMDWHFSITAKMISHIQLFKLSRPTSRFTANELVNLILTKVEERSKII